MSPCHVALNKGIADDSPIEVEAVETCADLLLFHLRAWRTCPKLVFHSHNETDPVHHCNQVKPHGMGLLYTRLNPPQCCLMSIALKSDTWHWRKTVHKWHMREAFSATLKCNESSSIYHALHGHLADHFHPETWTLSSDTCTQGVRGWGDSAQGRPADGLWPLRGIEPSAFHLQVEGLNHGFAHKRLGDLPFHRFQDFSAAMEMRRAT